jgi:hypothetical protein
MQSSQTPPTRNAVRQFEQLEQHARKELAEFVPLTSTASTDALLTMLGWDLGLSASELHASIGKSAADQPKE